MAKESKWIVTTAQADVLCTFFEENPEVIIGYKKTPRCIDVVQYKWKNITPQLNSLGRGRDHKSWAKYLCNIKAKLKRKKVKWSQSGDGTGPGPIILNADDFNGIELRMLQVLHTNSSRKKVPDIHDLNTSDLDVELENDIKVDEKHCIEKAQADVVEPLSWHEISKPADSAFIRILSNDSPLFQTQIPTAHNNIDEFDTFGKNIAQQLKTLPLNVALETQEMLLSVLRKQRLKVLSG